MKELYVLYGTAASLGFFHTILGPDHYVPFIVMGKARNWSKSKTLWITFISGIGHVGSTIILGIIGVALGISIKRLESIEAFRGEIVGWMLFLFGIIYFLYGVYKFMKGNGHLHLLNFLLPKNVREMQHLPSIEKEIETEEKKNITAWMLFLIFVLGPCEVLIPLLIFPAAEHSTTGIATVTVIFSVVTVITMLGTVYLGYKGTSYFNTKNRGEFIHILAGLVIIFLSVSILFLGW